MKAIYYGHSCIRLKSKEFDILFDPFITPNSLAKHIDVSDIHPQYILLSHGHLDHVADMETIQKQSGAKVIAIVETAEWVRRQGVDPDKVLEMNFGGTLKTDFGSVKMVYALHTNSTPDGQYGGMPVGFILTIHGKKLYFAGDTALTMEMKLLESVDLDWAFLPIGGHYTMDVEDAIKAATIIDCNNIVGIHYNTFPPISIDKQKAIQQFEDAGFQLYLPDVGEGIQLYNIW
jgi:L-ascorbate metabolism protein UlaG (beta-lactamase superfamily)